MMDVLMQKSGRGMQQSNSYLNTIVVMGETVLCCCLNIDQALVTLSTSFQDICAHNKQLVDIGGFSSVNSLTLKSTSFWGGGNLCHPLCGFTTVGLKIKQGSEIQEIYNLEKKKRGIRPLYLTYPPFFSFSKGFYNHPKLVASGWCINISGSVTHCEWVGGTNTNGVTP